MLGLGRVADKVPATVLSPETEKEFQPVHNTVSGPSQGAALLDGGSVPRSMLRALLLVQSHYRAPHSDRKRELYIAIRIFLLAVVALLPRSLSRLGGCQGWEYREDVRYKPGWISTTPGARITFAIKTGSEVWRTSVAFLE